MAKTEKFANAAEDTLNGAITSGATSLTVNSASEFPTDGDFRIKVESEIMIVTAVSTNTFTVTRGQEGTSAAAHADGIAVVHVLSAGSLQVFRNEIVDPDTAGGRLTVQTGVPLPTTDQSGSTIYYTPFRHNRISLYDGTDWRLTQFSEVSVAVPSTKFRFFDIFGVRTAAGALSIETVDWNQPTHTITNATNASPIVITTSASHGLANGEQVAIDGIVGNTAPNGLVWEVANVTATTFELVGSTGNGAYTSGGTVYEVTGATRATSIGTQDTVPIKSGDATRRYLGTGYTYDVSGTLRDQKQRRFLFNYTNRVERQVNHTTLADTHTYTSAAWRPWNNNGQRKVEMIVGYDSLELFLLMNARCAAGSNVNDKGALVGVGIDQYAAANFKYIEATDTIFALQASVGGRIPLAVGYHFAAVLEFNRDTTNAGTYTEFTVFGGLTV